MNDSHYDPPEPRRLGRRMETVPGPIALPVPYIDDPDNDVDDSLEFEAEITFDEGRVFSVRLTTEYRPRGLNSGGGRQVEIIDCDIDCPAIPASVRAHLEEMWAERVIEDHYS